MYWYSGIAGLYALYVQLVGVRLMQAILIELVHLYGNEYQLTAEEPTMKCVRHDSSTYQPSASVVAYDIPDAMKGIVHV